MRSSVEETIIVTPSDKVWRKKRRFEWDDSPLNPFEDYYRRSYLEYDPTYEYLGKLYIDYDDGLLLVENKDKINKIDKTNYPYYSIEYVGQEIL